MNSNDPNFSIIIPNYNGEEFISECLASLYRSIKASLGKFEIIIIDNASNDKSITLIKEFFKKYRSSKLSGQLYQLNKNLGFSPAINLGVEKSNYDHVVICNNDLTVEKKYFQLISQSIKENKNPKIVSFFGTVLNKEKNRIESQGLKFFISGKAKNISNKKPFKKTLLPKNKLVWGTSGALVVYKKDIFKKIGGLDSDFFAYLEDVDFSLRLNKLNLKTFYIPKALSFHLGGGTSDKLSTLRRDLSYRNWFYLILKNYSFKEIIKNLFSIIIQRLRDFSALSKTYIKIYQLKSIYKLPLSLFKIHFQILKNIPKMLKKRKEIKKLIKLAKENKL